MVPKAGGGINSAETEAEELLLVSLNKTKVSCFFFLVVDIAEQNLTYRTGLALFQRLLSSVYFSVVSFSQVCMHQLFKETSGRKGPVLNVYGTLFLTLLSVYISGFPTATNCLKTEVGSLWAGLH